MPMVRRTVVDAPDTTKGKITSPHVLFVPAAKLRPTDTVVVPTNRQLRDLAYRFPDEPSGVGRRTFAELLEARGVTPYEPPVVAEERDGDEIDALAAMALRMFPAMRQEEALQLIERTNDLNLLKRLFQAELSGGTPRARVVEAFGAKGLVAELAPDAEAGEGLDLGGTIPDPDAPDGAGDEE